MERLAEAYSSKTLNYRDILSEYSYKARGFDILVITAVPILLFVLTKTQPDFQDQLVLTYDNPSLYAFYTTHFIHESSAHLRSNLTSYLVVVPLTYLISLRAGLHREFRLGFLLVSFVLPPILSVVSFLSLDLVIGTIFGIDSDVQSSRGFSALAGAFVGMLTVAVADLFRQLADREESIWSVIGVMFWYGLAVAFWGVFDYVISPLTVLFVLLPTAYTAYLVWKVGREYDVEARLREGGWLQGQPATVGLLVIGFFAAVWGTQGLMAFPWFEGGTNSLSHFVGLLAGIGIEAVLTRL